MGKYIRYKWLEEKGYNVYSDSHQLELVKSLWEHPNHINFVGVDARAGTGKTALSVLCGAYAIENQEYDRIIYIRNSVAVRDIGFLKGSEEDKLAPYFEPFLSALDKVRPGTYEVWKEKGLIECTSSSFLRGINFERAFIIIDEAQNMSLHELQTILTRPHDDCKVVLIGSHRQVDTPKLERYKGLTPFEIYLRHFEGHNARIHTLEKNYRGKLSNHADSVLETIKNMEG